MLVMGKSGLFVLVVGGNTVGAWVWLSMAIMGWAEVGMEVIGREYMGHRYYRLAT